MHFKILIYIYRVAETLLFNMHLTHIAGILQMPHMVHFMACLKCAFSLSSELNVVNIQFGKVFLSSEKSFSI